MAQFCKWIDTYNVHHEEVKSAPETLSAGCTDIPVLLLFDFTQ